MAFKDLFARYFYGKPDKADYTQADLPETRRQLFFQVLRVRWGGMVGLNLLYLLFWLPAAVWTFLCLAQVYAQLTPGQLALGGALNVNGLVFTWLLVLFPLVALAGPANMGVSYVLRNWARDEHAYAWSDFWHGFRKNWKQGLALGAVSGFVPLALYVWLNIVDVYGSAIVYVPAALAAICALIYALAAMLMPMMIVTYRQGFFGHLKNAVIISLAELPRAIGVKLLTLVMPAIACACQMIDSERYAWVTSLILGLYCVFLLAFNKLILASYANAMCEKHINTKIDGAPVNIGLRREE